MGEGQTYFGKSFTEKTQSAHKWDNRFLQLAELIGSWSKDPSTKSGAVIVRPDRTIASVGFNGFAKMMNDDPKFYADRDLKYSRVIHSEVNALIHSREPVEGFTLYTHPLMCCDRCVVQMIQAGITRFVYPEASMGALERWGKSFELSEEYMAEARVTRREVTDYKTLFYFPD